MNNNGQAFPKLFLFCIGGTGARVLKSLAFLMSTGVKIRASKIIPIVIDPDRANGDVNRTIEILRKYQIIHNQLDFSSNEFFRTPIQTLSSLDAINDDGQEAISNSGFKFGIDGTKEGKFRDFLSFDQLEGGNRALISALFSEKNLNAELKVGFKGNPHMGSVVLNRFTDSEDFKFFASRFNEGDRIFIVSSIFGGTGAAGFPLMVKNIREPKDGISNPERLKNASLGAITVTPYFGVAPTEKSDIDKGTFISKTKAALNYYSKNLTGNRSINALYYIGDPQTTDYANNEGEAAQRNHAHLVEFLSALAIVDFMDIGDSKLHSVDGKASSPIYKEYGLNGDVTKVNFTHLGRNSKNRVASNLIQYTYANQYWNNKLSSKFPNQPWAKGKYENSFLSGEFFSQDLRQFNRRYLEWLEEMAINERGFAPFKVKSIDSLLHTLVEGIEQKKKGLLIKSNSWDYSDFDGYLNIAAREIGDREVIKMFMSVFFKATKKIIEERINL